MKWWIIWNNFNRTDYNCIP